MSDEAVIVRGLVKDFPGVRAIDHLSFDVEAGEIFGIVGPDGAGKTTTMRILAGVLTPGDVRATLGEVITGQKRGRLNDGEIVVFDSTGVAIEDVAAAAVTYERAVSQGVGLEVRLSS